MTKTSTRESGFTLLELLLVIGVAALLLIGGIATYRMVSDGNKTTDATRLLLTIRQQTQSLAQQQGGAYTSLDYNGAATVPATNPLVVAGILNASQRNPFGGTIVVTGAATTLTVALSAVPKAACVRLMQAITNPAEITSVAVGTTSYTSAGGTIPVSVVNATTACAGATNTITWIFP